MKNKITIDKTGNLEVIAKNIDWSQKVTIEKINVQLSKEECRRLIEELEAYVKESK